MSALYICIHSEVVTRGKRLLFRNSLKNGHCKILYSKTCLKRSPKKNTKIGFQYRLSLNACQKYCRMLQGEHSAINLTCIKLPFSIKTLFLSIFKWPLKTGFTVSSLNLTVPPFSVLRKILS